jgi:hypothetical protein
MRLPFAAKREQGTVVIRPPSRAFLFGELMSKGRHAFKFNDLKRAIKGAVAAGVEIAKAEIEPDTGKIVLIFGKSVASHTGTPNEWDDAE